MTIDVYIRIVTSMIDMPVYDEILKKAHWSICGLGLREKSIWHGTNFVLSFRILGKIDKDENRTIVRSEGTKMYYRIVPSPNRNRYKKMWKLLEKEYNGLL